MSTPTQTLTQNQTILERIGMAAAIAAALHTGLLAELARGPVTEEELTRRLGLDRRATTLLLDLLAAEALVRREGEQVAAGEALLPAGQLPGGFELALGMWAHTEAFVRTGTPFVNMDGSVAEREAAYRNVVSGLAALFQQAARELAGRLPLRPANILDVGCGSGVWSLAFAERHPDARATGLDLPAVLESFKARASELALTDRVETIASSMHEAEVPSGAFDLVIIANVLRLETPERASALVRRIARGVAPGGALLVVDALAAGTPELERARALYALHLGLRTRTGQVHSPTTISGWLAEAGLPHVNPIDVAGGTGGLGGLLATRQ